ncbi:hypothetical protein CROQUDRAFT_657317 [Cronartium quercuum f. sp. fusiforme G11]|uniref:Uncharacterized protein n=1 Tax=Cronartium quercuum f. sp. fusiforme G11 TaxID=708437 RepID=A0A9P6NIB4_9BASI|nr:hypothetical protein CROQUDRAFT_657317 [Cronartium quercuum f. sp. fusiforme G11]
MTKLNQLTPSNSNSNQLISPPPNLVSLPNTNFRTVSFHSSSNSIHSHTAQPIHTTSNSSASSHIRTSSRLPSPPIKDSPHSHVPDRIVTGILRSSLPVQQRPDHVPTLISKPRPQSMSATELATRHRAALLRLQHQQQQPINFKSAKASRPSPLSTSFSAPILASSSSPNSNPGKARSSDLSRTRADQSQTPNRSYANVHARSDASSNPSPDSVRTRIDKSPNRNHRASAYVQSLTQADSGKRLVDQKELSEAEIALLCAIPSLPPSKNTVSTPLKKIGEEKKTKSKVIKDRFSWFDY